MTLSVATVVDNQYQNVGVIFDSKGVVWGPPYDSEASSLPNFLVGYGPPGSNLPPVPPYPINPVTFHFVVPSTSDPAVTNEVSFYTISVGWALVTATAYDGNNNVIASQTVQNLLGPSNGLNNHNLVTLTGARIHKVSVVTTTPYTYDGWGIDDLSFGTLSPVTITVGIDIKPGSDENPINLNDQGLLPVAILGSATFDVTTINPATIEIGSVSLATRGSAKAPKLAYSFEDVNGDGYLDMIVFFKVQDLVDAGALTSMTTALTLTGQLYDLTTITGTDSVRIVPP